MVRIFIVEDNEDIACLIEEYLLLAGHEVMAKAYDGEQALKIFKELPELPDIIIMDHRMPLKSGLEVTKEIFSIKPDMVVIFVSADFAIKEKAIKSGAHAFLSKPIDFSVLVEEIGKVTN